MMNILIACSGFLTDSTLMNDQSFGPITDKINMLTESYTGEINIYIIDSATRFKDPMEIEIPIHFKINILEYKEEKVSSDFTQQIEKLFLSDTPERKRLTRYITQCNTEDNRILHEQLQANRTTFNNKLDKKDNITIHTKFGQYGGLIPFLENNQIVFDTIIFASCDDPEFMFSLISKDEKGDIKTNVWNADDFNNYMDEHFTKYIKPGGFFLQIHEAEFVHFDNGTVPQYKLERRRMYIAYISARFTKISDGIHNYYQKNSVSVSGGTNMKYHRHKQHYKNLISY